MHGKTSVTLADLSDWNYDGSSTGQAPGEDSEVIIKPQALFNDPFRGPPHVLVMCDCYTPKGEPIPTNTRFPANEIFNKGLEHEPWFGIEQGEYSSLSTTHVRSQHESKQARAHARTPLRGD